MHFFQYVNSLWEPAAIHKRTGHSPNDVLLQPVEKLTYDKNSSSRFKIIKIHETELKRIKLLKNLFHWDLMIIFTTKVIFLKCLILACFLSWKFENVNLDHMVLGPNIIYNSVYWVQVWYKEKGKWQTKKSTL